ncbi:MAG: glycosidase [Planctomycetota bacterium]|nr:glycosidase [Planctomycetota bacterium]
MLQLKRAGDGPVLKPRPEVPWEKDTVFNAAAIHDKGKFHLLYRAVAHNPGDRNRSWIGYAWSSDGLHFERLDKPVLSPGEVPEESQGVEDPRVVKIGRTFYMCYTAYDLKRTQVALATSSDLVHWKRQGVILSNTVLGNNKDASLFPQKIGGRYCLMHRPVPDIYLSFGDDLHTWTDHTRIMQPEFEWEATKIGGGAQPIQTKKGWLLVYHGVDKTMTYRLGVALLDLDDPTKVLKRQREFILQPELAWELKGDVSNVVFTCGAVLLGKELWVYYGCADSVIGVAKGNVDDFLNDV